MGRRPRLFIGYLRHRPRRERRRSSAPRSPHESPCRAADGDRHCGLLLDHSSGGRRGHRHRARSGFADWRQAVASPASPSVIEIVLQPAAIRDEVTVTPTRSEEQLGTIPASVSVIGQLDIQRRPAVVPDDLLRQLPEFSLFRRSSSLRAPDQPGRLASRHRPERRQPQPRAPRWRAVQRRVRRLGALDGAADGERPASKWSTGELEPAAPTRWAACSM